MKKRNSSGMLHDEGLSILEQVNKMTGRWDKHSFTEVLRSYSYLDLVLKNSFLKHSTLTHTSESYSSYHDIWHSATGDLYSFYESNNLFADSEDSVKLQDLIQLSFFNTKDLLIKRPARMSSTPEISVILPVFRSRKYLWEALRSLYQQTFQDFEIIIVNEVNNDDPIEDILSIFDDDRTTIIQKPANGNLGLSLNLGIKHAKGRFIARMDADDIAHPERFAKQINFLNTNPNIHFCGTQYRAFGITNNWNHAPFPESHGEIQCRSLKYCSFLHPTVMWHNETLQKHNLWYNEKVLSEDAELFARIVYTMQTANLPDQLLLYRREDSNLSLTNFQKRDDNNRSISVKENLQLELMTLSLLTKTLTYEEREFLQQSYDILSYGEALRVFRYRLEREDLSTLLPPDSSKSLSLLRTNLNGRIPVIWGYGWNGHVLEFLLQEEGLDYRIVDQKLQKLNPKMLPQQAMTVEALVGEASKYYILISMDRHYRAVTEMLQHYGYQSNIDFIEYFL